VSNGSQWPGAGSDTGNVLSGTPLGDLFSGDGAATGFSIDYERIPQAITDLKHAAEFFESRVKVAEQLARIPPPGADEVSIHAVEQLGKWASDTGQNNLGAILQAGALQLRDLAHKLEEDLKNYLKAEEINLPKDSTGGLPL
jgi:PE family